jgi:hypothetical protein
MAGRGTVRALAVIVVEQATILGNGQQLHRLEGAVRNSRFIEAYKVVGLELNVGAGGGGIAEIREDAGGLAGSCLGRNGHGAGNLLAAAVIGGEVQRHGGVEVLAGHETQIVQRIAVLLILGDLVIVIIEVGVLQTGGGEANLGGAVILVIQITVGGTQVFGVGEIQVLEIIAAVALPEEIVEKYNGQVPEDIDELTKFKGVGRKTANLVVAKGFNKPAICVDVHVHRICNRWGYVKTKEPDETEMVLRKKLPVKHWMDFNTLLVTHGQNICKPQKPNCKICSLSKYCKKII